MKRLKRAARACSLLVACAMTLIFAPGSGAIVNGHPDTTHPWVGLYAAYDANGDLAGFCSGSVISQRLFLTAAHCTTSPVVPGWFSAQPVKAAIFLGPDVGPPPQTFAEATLTAAATGVPIPTPGWDFWATLPDSRDIGLIRLDPPGIAGPYGQLAHDYLDDLATARGLKDTAFTVVGYGLPNAAVRMTTTVKLVTVRNFYTDGYNVFISANVGGGKGHVYWGDSGGPLINSAGQIVAVNSAALTPNFMGVFVDYRVDTDEAWSFIADNEP